MITENRKRKFEERSKNKVPFMWNILIKKKKIFWSKEEKNKQYKQTLKIKLAIF